MVGWFLFLVTEFGGQPCPGQVRWGDTLRKKMVVFEVEVGGKFHIQSRQLLGELNEHRTMNKCILFTRDTYSSVKV